MVTAQPLIGVTDAGRRLFACALETPGVAHTLCLPGMSYILNANSSNYSNVFIIFKPFHDRRDPELSGDAIAAKVSSCRRPSSATCSSTSPTTT